MHCSFGFSVIVADRADLIVARAHKVRVRLFSRMASYLDEECMGDSFISYNNCLASYYS